MDILVATCACGKRYRFKQEHAGRQGKCPGCGQTLALEPARAVAPPARSAGRWKRLKTWHKAAIVGGGVLAAGFLVFVVVVLGFVVAEAVAANSTARGQKILHDSAVFGPDGSVVAVYDVVKHLSKDTGATSLFPARGGPVGWVIAKYGSPQKIEKDVAVPGGATVDVYWYGGVGLGVSADGNISHVAARP